VLARAGDLITDTGVRRAARKLAVSTLLRAETPQGRLFTLGMEYLAHGQALTTEDLVRRYEQVTADGLNNVSEEWNISISGKGAVIKQVKAFLDLHAGAKSFLWTPPLGELGMYLGGAPSISGGQGDYYTLTATFRQSFHP